MHLANGFLIILQQPAIQDYTTNYILLSFWLTAAALINCGMDPMSKAVFILGDHPKE